ncbi:MAG: AarF/UbiB family protein, partial [Polyangiales bacterium]
SYLWLQFKKKLYGQAYYDRTIIAVHRRNARRIERALLELQGLFIKVGQLLSIMANFLPAEFREELEGMQDDVPPRPFEEIEERVQKELGAHPDQLFVSFERVPIAAASLGQVHEAMLADGTRCAVKVQHCDIEEIVALDLVAIRKIMNIVQWFVPVQGLDNYYREIRELILQELDFKREAQNILRIRKIFEGDDHVDTPLVIERLSAQRVLTLSFVEGVKVGDVKELDRLGIDRKDLARQIVHAFCQMIFMDGVYHADPHPGNLLVDKLPDGTSKLVLIDFGAVAELSPQMKEGIPEFLEGVLRRDTDRLIKAMRKMGFLSYGSDEAVVEKVIDHFHRKFQDEVHIESLNLKDIKIDPQKGFENLIDLRNMNVGLKELSQSIHIPRDWVLLERTLLLLTGVCTQLDPEMNPMSIVRPYLEKFVLGNRDWTQIAIEAVKDTMLKAVGLPEELHRYIQKAVRGELEVRVRGMREGFDGIYALGRQAMYLALSMASGGVAFWLRIHGDDEGARWALYPTVTFGVLFVLTSIVGRPSRRGR